MAYEVVAEQIRIEAAAGAPPMGAYLARPAEPGDHPVVLVGAELWGVTEAVRKTVRDVAALGFVAVAPDLYYRAGEEGTAAGMAQSPENRTRAFALLDGFARDEAEADLRAAVAHARQYAGASTRTAMIGFSLGGHIAYFAATRLELDAVVAYFPGWLTTSGTALSRPAPLAEDTPAIARVGTRVLLFFAGRDHVIGAAEREEVVAGLASAGVPHEVVVYPEAQHAFFFPGHPPYDKESAEDSWRRAGAFLEGV
ncbi:dienelactone hydrolase family protein [Kitasatospora sp. NPDC001603]|uniref:dienelactone hydrolase family protein n=1 Tax=Kitasatospora sp. NPDC001603 TaxID=3154388 RepID=UPI00332067BE